MKRLLSIYDCHLSGRKDFRWKGQCHNALDYSRMKSAILKYQNFQTLGKTVRIYSGFRMIISNSRFIWIWVMFGFESNPMGLVRIGHACWDFTFWGSIHFADSSWLIGSLTIMIRGLDFNHSPLLTTAWNFATAEPNYSRTGVIGFSFLFHSSSRSMLGICRVEFLEINVLMGEALYEANKPHEGFFQDDDYY